MAHAFPASLPQCPQTWAEVDKPTLIRSDVDVGVAKVRRRYTRDTALYEVSLTLPKDKYQAFEDFYRITLKDGLETFNYDHPYTGKVLEVRFVSPPTKSMTGVAFQVSMQWESI